MKILSIETSCDDTGITILEAKGGATNASFKILADASNSQIVSHIPYGGVYPALAKREHAKNLPILFEEVLKQAKLNKENKNGIDAVAVTYGPGLEMCLWEGITFAKDLAKRWDVPLIPTNHMEGHILSIFGKKNIKTNKGKFTVKKVQAPLLSLLVSGGHTQLIVSRKWMQYEIIGETLDDAVGEAYDKVARMLGLDYPGGPQISRLAEEARGKQVLRGLSKENKSDGLRESAHGARTDSDPAKISFPHSLPRPMMYSKDFKFSYSGLKTAVLYLIRDLGGLEKLSEETKAQIALEFENAAIEVLIYKTAKAIEKYKIKTVIVGGGVACNTHLQREMKKLAKAYKFKLLLPQKELTGDNSLMIGIAGYLQYIKNKKKVPPIDTIKATGNLKL
ncbi:MAG TPA: tRNA (adenosine(37)-N6)-threonylcarbamoyltransferase complex transferase subunit TsaD [Candidatus Paceibacterota bacterium]|jgi:N6-L-threonylcarbamoyladenine synthase|nr:tRNA (adenosine(37)-N6)-threonylcarbamoyltransferase complex transferase subunit TsaD [Candidatus Paceibacterota bacterium]